MTTNTNRTGEQIADSTFENSFSAERYGRAEWRNAAKLLEARGFTPDEIEWVLRSKWMRWAADRAGAATGLALGAFLDNPDNDATRATAAHGLRTNE